MMKNVPKNLISHKLGNTRFRRFLEKADEYIRVMRDSGKPVKTLRLAGEDWEFLELHFIDKNVELKLENANYRGIPLSRCDIHD